MTWIPAILILAAVCGFTELMILIDGYQYRKAERRFYCDDNRGFWQFTVDRWKGKP